jgi:hypothetical protein
MVDDNIHDDTDGRVQTVGFIDKLDEIVLSAEMRVDVQIVVDVVAMISARVVFEDRREPDGGATEAGDVIQMVRDPLDFSSIKIIGRLNAGGALAGLDWTSRFIIMKPVHEQEIDELLPPFPAATEIRFVGERRKINFGNGC